MKKTKPTDKQKRFSEEKVINGKSDYRAAIDAGYSPATAKNAYANIVDKQGVISYKEELQEILKIEVGPQKVAKAIREALEAEKGDISGSVWPDHRIRIDAAKTAATFMDADGTKKVDVTSKGEKVGGIFNNLDDLPDDSMLKQFLRKRK